MFCWCLQTPSNPKPCPALHLQPKWSSTHFITSYRRNGSWKRKTFWFFSVIHSILSQSRSHCWKFFENCQQLRPAQGPPWGPKRNLVLRPSISAINSQVSRSLAHLLWTNCISDSVFYMMSFMYVSHRTQGFPQFVVSLVGRQALIASYQAKHC